VVEDVVAIEVVEVSVVAVVPLEVVPPEVEWEVSLVQEKCSDFI